MPRLSNPPRQRARQGTTQAHWQTSPAAEPFTLLAADRGWLKPTNSWGATLFLRERFAVSERETAPERCSCGAEAAVRGLCRRCSYRRWHGRHPGKRAEYQRRWWEQTP